MKAPFPWFGGKSSVADLVWSRFGDTTNYVEPFAGSLAVLLARPHWPFAATCTETVNDMNGWLCNTWRALALAPDATAEAADWPVSELDLHSRGDALFYPEYHAAGERLYATHGGLSGFVTKLRADPEFHDPKIAGWWLWGQSSWIGDNWGRSAHNAKKVDGKACAVVSALPHLGNAGQGVNRQLPHLGDAGRGVNRKLPHLGNAGQGVNRKRPHLGTAGRATPVPGGCEDRRIRLVAYFRTIADRLRGVRVCCGDWMRVCGPAVTTYHGMTAVFLDPPYALDSRSKVYGTEETGCWAAVCHWCAENGNDPLLRIALCGYDGGWTPPDGWECVAWKATGGYSNQGKTGDNKNRHRERIWFSPTCEKERQGKLL